jgi:hypothetical protein
MYSLKAFRGASTTSRRIPELKKDPVPRVALEGDSGGSLRRQPPPAASVPPPPPAFGPLSPLVPRPPSRWQGERRPIPLVD